eukprot:CAMPEP_0194534422 /NCGR_PEP_ID=MMETSP0253-20130528/72635_1 /TAXON_ID=2966 /ORGANISM="Noctiluca scintillans" /LENGTH=83 /DNA_ID=CAMNT_0039380087 /DNA_START=137 /DNA_END=384 /DNA_ORIENTATION=+
MVAAEVDTKSDELEKLGKSSPIHNLAVVERDLSELFEQEYEDETDAPQGQETWKGSQFDKLRQLPTSSGATRTFSRKRCNDLA